MARKIYRIDEFMGLDQSMGENGMAASYSPDACNMDTADGELTVAKGYTRYITSAVPGTEAIRRMFLFHSGSGDQVIVVTGGSVYAYREGVWVLIYTFTGGLTGGRVDFTEARIDTTDYLLIASGEQQIVKYNGTKSELFGSSDGLSDKPVSYLAAYRSRLFAAGDSSCPNRLYWSKLPGGSRTIESWGEESGS